MLDADDPSAEYTAPMRHPPGTKSPLPHAVVAGMLLVVAIAGCEPSDPLAAIRQQQATGDYAGSLEPLRALLDERPDDAEVQFLYGRALALTGQTSLAEWSLRKAMDDPEWLVPAGLQLAFGALSTRNYATAIEAADRILEAHPDNVDVLLMRANAYTHSKLDHEAALADVDRILELDPDNLDAMEPRILALLALDRIDEAAHAIEELGVRIDEAELGAGVPAWHCATTAIFADESGERELAEERWGNCLEHYPAHPNVVEKARDPARGPERGAHRARLPRGAGGAPAPRGGERRGRRPAARGDGLRAALARRRSVGRPRQAPSSGRRLRGGCSSGRSRGEAGAAVEQSVAPAAARASGRAAARG
jgi:hypothetical protein